MINLIPKEEKKKMRTDFLLRAGVLFLLVIDFGLIIFSISSLPAYFIALEKNRFITNELESQKNEPLPQIGAQALSAVKDIGKKISLIETGEKSKFLVSENIIKALLLNRENDIKIRRISYDVGEAGKATVNIAGTAPSREVLLLFRQSLEQNPAFKKVDLPISNFVKGSNIEFSLSLIPA